MSKLQHQGSIGKRLQTLPCLPTSDRVSGFSLGACSVAGNDVDLVEGEEDPVCEALACAAGQAKVEMNKRAIRGRSARRLCMVLKLGVKCCSRHLTGPNGRQRYSNSPFVLAWSLLTVVLMCGFVAERALSRGCILSLGRQELVEIRLSEREECGCGYRRYQNGPRWFDE